ncbi:MAG: 1,4-alpha-glucan branching protein GlgB [Sterolibacteriaceae bacterium]|nr:1,4-alpha-glucan branching protein GlgB [Candidatus Methylophosphatis haderslevensis]
MDRSRLTRLAEGRDHDPFAILGRHRSDSGGTLVRTWQPGAENVLIETAAGFAPMRRVHPAGVFEWNCGDAPERWRLRLSAGDTSWELQDCWAFPPQGDEQALYLFSEGRNHAAWKLLGALPVYRDGHAGVCFRVWAPNAQRVSVVGDFNRWDGLANPMASLGASGVWELFIPALPAGSLYRFEIRNRQSGDVFVKIDPYGREFELRPSTAARVCAVSEYRWRDASWLESRARLDWQHAPMSVYELHAGSWRRHADGSSYNWRELAEALAAYVLDAGYTHLELMPITEHPLDESWGYQTTGYFAPTSRLGTPDDFRAFVDALHAAGIGVILDWVPGHFPQDAWALAHYDGSALYEHEDPQQSLHPDWGTHIFNYGRCEVRSFLLSSAHYWLSEFHIDGLRVDAVASMLYLDYSRKQGEWTPNRHGGRENLDAIDFLRELNVMVHAEFPGALTAAEESTAWPMVSRPTYVGGLGFSVKWNMGWMNDTLSYFGRDPVYRRYHHALLTFGQVYAYSENFVLPLSHDEVVHGKRALLGKMPGDKWLRCANLRLLLAYQTMLPGKKLGFMGSEFGQEREWSEHRELDWGLLDDPAHRGIANLTRDLNRIYRDRAELHELDFQPEGFQWIDCHDADHSVIAFLRRSRDGRVAIVVLNFTPVPQFGYRIGTPAPGNWREAINTDSAHYGGSNLGNAGRLTASELAWLPWPASIELTLPPLGALLLLPDQ